MKIAIGAVLPVVLLLGCDGDDGGGCVSAECNAYCMAAFCGWPGECRGGVCVCVTLPCLDADADADGDGGADGDGDGDADADADGDGDVAADADGDVEDDVEAEAEVEACVPETDEDFCSRLSAACAELTANDNCGDERTVASCGTCDDSNLCTADVCNAVDHACANPPVDADDDGYAGSAVGGASCGGNDCNDDDPTVNPGAAPVACSTEDHDCNGYADSDNDGDTHADITCTGGDDCNDGDGTVWSAAWWLDPTTGYLWENPPSDTSMNWDDAVAYCGGLSLCGYPPGEWRLPTISELRSLIRGCPGTVTGGACGVTDSCLDLSCWSYSACYTCPYVGGPGAGGCYWDPAVAGGCDAYWSSSSYSGSSSEPLYVHFNYGYLDIDFGTDSNTVRCVRRGP